MAKKTSPSEREPVYRNCIPCGARFLAGYTGTSVLSMGCQACAAGLFRVLAQSETVLVPLPDQPAAPATDSTAPEHAPAPALPAAATPTASDDTPRARRQPRPRARRVPLYDPLTVGLRRRFRRDS